MRVWGTSLSSSGGLDNNNHIALKQIEYDFFFKTSKKIWGEKGKKEKEKRENKFLKSIELLTRKSSWPDSWRILEPRGTSMALEAIVVPRASANPEEIISK